MYIPFIAHELFDRFFNIEAVFSGMELCKINYQTLKEKFHNNSIFSTKRSLKKDWIIKTKDLANLDPQIYKEVVIKEHTIPETKLSISFRRKLTLVYPPNFKKEQKKMEDRNSNVNLEADSNKTLRHQ